MVVNSAPTPHHGRRAARPPCRHHRNLISELPNAETPRRFLRRSPPHIGHGFRGAPGCPQANARQNLKQCGLLDVAGSPNHALWRAAKWPGLEHFELGAAVPGRRDRGIAMARGRTANWTKTGRPCFTLPMSRLQMSGRSRKDVFFDDVVPRFQVWSRRAGAWRGVVRRRREAPADRVR